MRGDARRLIFCGSPAVNGVLLRRWRARQLPVSSSRPLCVEAPGRARRHASLPFAVFCRNYWQHPISALNGADYIGRPRGSGGAPAACFGSSVPRPSLLISGPSSRIADGAAHAAGKQLTGGRSVAPACVFLDSGLPYSSILSPSALPGVARRRRAHASTRLLVLSLFFRDIRAPRARAALVTWMLSLRLTVCICSVAYIYSAVLARPLTFP